MTSTYLPTLLLVLTASGSGVRIGDPVVSGLGFPAAGSTVQVQELTPREYVQKGSGANQGKKMMVVASPTFSKGTQPYRLSWRGLITPRTWSGVRAPEGLSGIGLSGRRWSWYSGGFFDVVVNRQSLSNFRPALSWESSATHESLVAEWETPYVRLLVRFTSRQGSGALLISGEWESKRTHASPDVEVHLRGFLADAVGVRPHSYCANADGWTPWQDEAIVDIRRAWVVLAADDGRPAVKCPRAPASAVAWSPFEFSGVGLRTDGRAHRVQLDVRPRKKAFHLAIWDFPKTAPEQAVEELAGVFPGLDLSGIDIPIGLATQDIPPGEHRAGVLVAGGVPHATLIVSKEAGPAAVYAAESIQEVLHKMTGTLLPVRRDTAPVEGNRVLLGATAWTDEVVTPAERAALGKEEYVVRLEGRDLALVGGGAQGLAYAPSELFDRLGARWYLPGPLGECIPRRADVSFAALDIRRGPSFPMRWVGHDPDWSARNRTNRRAPPGIDPAFKCVPRIFHSQLDLVPQSVYGKTHPEFFALIGGERSTHVHCKLCNSNAELPRLIAQNLAACLEATPDADLLALSPTDGQYWCECAECKAMDEADVSRAQWYSQRQLILYDRILDELAKTHPKQRVVCGAYNTYTWPPSDPPPRPRPNMAVMLCHYEDYCLVHSVADPDCEPNQRYLQIIRGWRKLTPHIYFYEYYNKINWMDLPWPIATAIRHDIPFYKSLGVEGLFTQYSGGNIFTTFIPMYIAARLLWDHTADIDAFYGEFYPTFYGEAAGPMRRYHEALERRVASGEHHMPGNAPRNAALVFTPDLLDGLDGCLAAAQPLAVDPMVKQRVEKQVAVMEYTRGMAHYYRLRARAAELSEGERNAVLEQTLEAIDQLRAKLAADPERYDGVTVQRGGKFVNHPVTKAYYNKTKVQLHPEQAGSDLDGNVVVAGKVSGPWTFCLDPGNRGTADEWFGTTFDDRAWKPIDVGNAWENQGYPEYNGYAWYRTRLDIARDDRNSDLELYFLAVDGEGWVYWNGRMVQHHVGWSDPFFVRVPNASILHDRPNVLAVRVSDGKADGGITGAVLRVERRE